MSQLNLTILIIIGMVFISATPIPTAHALDTVCTHNFFSTHGSTNITVANVPNGDAVVAAYGTNLTGTKGHIIFFSSPNMSIWFDQVPGGLTYSYTSPGAISGYISCSTGLSQEIIRALFSQHRYVTTISNYSQVLILATCTNKGVQCNGGAVNGVAMHGITSSYENMFLSLYWFVTNVTGNQLSVSFSDGLSSVFIFGISTSQVGYVRGTVLPKQVTLLVNGSPTTITDGIINISLHFGTYNFTFLRKGYYNLSVVEVVYGGVVTPLSVRMGSPVEYTLARLNTLLGYAVIVLVISLAFIVPFRHLRSTRKRK